MGVGRVNSLPSSLLKGVFRVILKLYNTSDSNNTIGKTLTDEETFDITFKDTFNIINPVIVLKSNTPILKNYAQIPEFGRYYFITSIQIEPNKIYELFLECDVLETYKEDILASKGLVTRAGEGNKFYDGGLNSEVRKEVEIHESILESDFGNSIILVTIK